MLSPRIKQALPAIAGVILFVIAVAVLRVEIRTLSWSGLIGSVLGMPRDRLLIAALLTVINYAALTGYDFLAFAYIRRRLPRAKIALTAFLAYAFSNTIGFAMLTGASVRYRFYSRWGVTAGELSKIVFSYSVTFWLGLFALCGISLIANGIIAAGAALIALPIAYIAACAIRREPIRIGRIMVPLPNSRLAVGQLALSSLDWLLAAGVLFVLLPDGALPFITFAGLFLISILIGMISHVPGGVGVFESVIVLLLSPYLDSSAVLPALVVFRAIYFLAPLIVALVALVIDEAWQRRSHVVRAAARPAFAAMVLMLVATRRFIKDDADASPVPSDADLDDAARIIASQHATSPMLVFLRDKSLIFNDARTAFLMYAVQGKSWVVLGDPVGPPNTHTDMIRLFLNRCDEAGGTPVFYEVGAARLHLYADFGLRFVKIGEAARVDLQHFTLENHAGYRHRQAYKRVEKAGAAFHVLMPDDVVARLRELREVSDDWLAGRSTSEKGFSLGFFDEAYVARFPVAVIEKDNKIIAFANVWPGAGRGELSLDLMRHRHDAPSGIMESLVVHLMQWAQQHGYREFVLGMAPLSGFEVSPVASLWNRVGAFIYEYGEAIYNFQGLRAFKAKFHPEWEPHYLAYPGGLRLPRIMADVSALVAGGYSQIFRK